MYLLLQTIVAFVEKFLFHGRNRTLHFLLHVALDILVLMQSTDTNARHMQVIQGCGSMNRELTEYSFVPAWVGTMATVARWRRHWSW